MHDYCFSTENVEFENANKSVKEGICVKTACSHSEEENSHVGSLMQSSVFGCFFSPLFF